MANKISKDASKVLAGVSPQARDFVLSQSYGKSLTSGEAKRFLGQWNTQEAERKGKEDALLARTPDFLKNNPAFQSLPMDQKEIAVYNYEIQKTNNIDKAQKLAQALEQASAQADPYWKNIILLTQDEVLRGFEEATGDYNSSVERQLRLIDNINNDLEYNKDFLNLEQQNQLATIKRNFEASHENLVDSAAGAGLTFSTKRKIAEQRLKEENSGMVESTTRQYEKQIRDLTVDATRGNIEAQKEIEDLQRRFGQQKTDIGRKAESYLGSGLLPQQLVDQGYKPLGNVPGTLYDEKTRDVAARGDQIFKELSSASLNF